MSDYRDEIAALNARIEGLVQELADARATQPSGPPRCPFCRSAMVAGTLGTHERVGRVTAVVDLTFQRKEGEATEKVDRSRTPSADWYCGDCSSVIVKGRFAD